MNVITLINFEKYNGEMDGNMPNNPPCNPLDNSLNPIVVSNLQGSATHLITYPVTHLPQNEEKQQPTSNPNNKKDKEYIEKISTNVDTKDIAPVGADCANIPVVPKKTIRTWREDFEVYKQDLKSAYESLVNDWAFIAERQKYDQKLDIRLSMEKAYNDYWSTEAGWKKKKAAKSKELDWKRTFVNALSLGSNKVYLNASNRVLYEPATESQKKFTEYLKENAPLMLGMPIQPNDDEIASLRQFSNEILVAVVKEINNSRYLINGRNSVYQTILEVMSKK